MTTDLYALIEARPGNQNVGQPFYVGIGTKRRPYVHFLHARTPKGCRNRLLQMVISAHFESGVEPGVTVLATYETKDEAARGEIAAIKQYGRLGRDIGGILCNIAKGGQGPDVDLMNDPEIRAKIGAGSSANWAKPGKREAVSETLKTRHAESPERWAGVPESSRVAVTEFWSDPSRKEARRKSLTGVKKTMSEAGLAARRANARKPKSEAALAAARAAVERNWSDPTFVAKRSKNQAAAWADPEKRANMLAGRKEGIAKSWADPDVRARRIAGIKAAAARRAKDAEEHEAESLPLAD